MLSLAPAFSCFLLLSPAPAFPRLARLCAVPPQNLVLVEIIQSQVGYPLLVYFLLYKLDSLSRIWNFFLFTFPSNFFPFLTSICPFFLSLVFFHFSGVLPPFPALFLLLLRFPVYYFFLLTPTFSFVFLL
jgi:hypothetical protein